MNFKRSFLTLIAALVISTGAGHVAAQVRIAVVDLQRALNQTDDGRRAKRRLKRLFNRRQKALGKLEGELKKMKGDIEKQKGILSENALAKRYEEYQKVFVTYQSKHVEYQREIMATEGRLTKRILEKMQTILRGIGRDEGYTMIIEANEGGVVWVPNRLDITSKLIEAYNGGAEAGDGEAAAD